MMPMVVPQVVPPVVLWAASAATAEVAFTRKVILICV